MDMDNESRFKMTSFQGDHMQNKMTFSNHFLIRLATNAMNYENLHHKTQCLVLINFLYEQFMISGKES